MFRNVEISAEQNELVIENTHGDRVIVPADKRAWVQRQLRRGDHASIDKLVDTLPVHSDYAQDGTIIKNGKTVYAADGLPVGGQLPGGAQQQQPSSMAEQIRQRVMGGEQPPMEQDPSQAGDTLFLSEDGLPVGGNLDAPNVSVLVKKKEPSDSGDGTSNGLLPPRPGADESIYGKLYQKITHPATQQAVDRANKQGVEPEIATDGKTKPLPQKKPGDPWRIPETRPKGIANYQQSVDYIASDIKSTMSGGVSNLPWPQQPGQVPTENDVILSNMESANVAKVLNNEDDLEAYLKVRHKQNDDQNTALRAERDLLMRSLGAQTGESFRPNPEDANRVAELNRQIKANDDKFVKLGLAAEDAAAVAIIGKDLRNGKMSDPVDVGKRIHKVTDTQYGDDIDVMGTLESIFGQGGTGEPTADQYKAIKQTSLSSEAKAKADAKLEYEKTKYKWYQAGAKGYLDYHSVAAGKAYETALPIIQQINNLITAAEASPDKAVQYQLMQEVVRLRNTPEVQDYAKSVGMQMEYADLLNNAADQFPEVKRQLVRQAVNDNLGEMQKVKELTMLKEGDALTLPKLLNNWLVRAEPDDQQIKALAEKFNLPEEEIRKMADKSVRGFLGNKKRGVSMEGFLPGISESFDQAFADMVEGTRRALDVPGANLRNRLLSTRMENVAIKPQINKLNDDLGQWNINPYSITNVMGTGIGQTSALAAPTLGLGSAFAPLVSEGTTAMKVLDWTGTLASGSAMSYESAYQEASKMTDDESRRHWYARIISFENAAPELAFLSPVEVVGKIGGVLGRPTREQLFQDLKNMSGTGIAAGKKNLFIEGLKEGGLVIGQELGEEYLTNAATAVTNDDWSREQRLYYEKHGLTPPTAGENAIQTFVQTTLQTLPLAVGAGIGKRNDLSGISKEALFEAGNESDEYRQRFKDLRDGGQMTQDVYDEKMKIINTMQPIVAAVNRMKGPNGRNLSTEDKTEIAAQQYRMLVNEDVGKKTPLQAEKDEAEKDNKTAEAIQSTILYPGKPVNINELDPEQQAELYHNLGQRIQKTQEKIEVDKAMLPIYEFDEQGKQDVQNRIDQNKDALATMQPLHADLAVKLNKPVAPAAAVTAAPSAAEEITPTETVGVPGMAVTKPAAPPEIPAEMLPSGGETTTTATTEEPVVEGAPQGGGPKAGEGGPGGALPIPAKEEVTPTAKPGEAGKAAAKEGEVIQEIEYPQKTGKPVTSTISVIRSEKEGLITAKFKGARSDQPGKTVQTTGYLYGGQSKQTVKDFEKDYGIKINQTEELEGIGPEDIQNIRVREERAEGTGQSVTVRVALKDGTVMDAVSFPVNKRKFTPAPTTAAAPAEKPAEVPPAPKEEPPAAPAEGIKEVKYNGVTYEVEVKDGEVGDIKEKGGFKSDLTVQSVKDISALALAPEEAPAAPPATTEQVQVTTSPVTAPSKKTGRQSQNEPLYETSSAERVKSQRARVGKDAEGKSLWQKFQEAPKWISNRKNTISDNGVEVTGRWVLAPRESVTASHNTDFKPSPGYPVDAKGNNINTTDYSKENNRKSVLNIAPNFGIPALQNPPVISTEGIVLSHNGTKLAADFADEAGTMTRYDGELDNRLGDDQDYGQLYGASREDYDHVAKGGTPMLFFMTEDGEYTPEYLQSFNTRQTKDFTPEETAQQLSRIKPSQRQKVYDVIGNYETMGKFYADEKAVKDVFDMLESDGIITSFQRPGLENKGRATPAGKQFIESVLTAGALSDNSIGGLNTEGLRQYREKLVRALVDLAAISKHSQYSLENTMDLAVRLLYAAHKDYNGDVAAFLSNGKFDFGQPETSGEAILMATALQELTETEFAKFIRDYRTQVQKTVGVGGLFGQQAMPEKNAVLKELFNTTINNLERLKDAQKEAIKSRATPGAVAPAEGTGAGQPPVKAPTEQPAEKPAEEEVKPGEEELPPPEPVGTTRRLAGISGEIRRTARIENIDYQLYKETDGPGGATVIFDVESGKVVGVKKYPTYDAAAKGYEEAIRVAKLPEKKETPKEEVPPVAQPPAGPPSAKQQSLDNTVNKTVDDLMDLFMPPEETPPAKPPVKPPATKPAAKPTKKEEEAHAKELGRAAFENGLVRAPAQDIAVKEMMKDKGAGQSLHILTAWTKGWDEANLKAAKPKPPQKPNVPVEDARAQKDVAAVRADIVRRMNEKLNATKDRGERKAIFEQAELEVKAIGAAPLSPSEMVWVSAAPPAGQTKTPLAQVGDLLSGKITPQELINQTQNPQPPSEQKPSEGKPAMRRPKQDPKLAGNTELDKLADDFFNDVMGDGINKMILPTRAGTVARMRERIRRKNLYIDKEKDQLENLAKSIPQDLKGPATSRALLQKLIDDGAYPAGSVMHTLAQKLQGREIPVEWVSREAMAEYGGPDAAMFYSKPEHKIFLSQDIINEMNDAEKAYGLWSILHEVVHGYTARAIDNPRNAREREFKRETEALWNEAKGLKVLGDEFEKYGLSNASEFIAEIGSNPEFASRIKSARPTFFKRILNAIRRLFGYDPRTGDQIVGNALDALYQYSDYKNAQVKEDLPDYRNYFGTHLTLNPQRLQRGIAMLQGYLDAGKTKFSDIVDDMLYRYGERAASPQFITALSQAYAAHRAGLPRAERAGYDSEDAVDDYIEATLPQYLNQLQDAVQGGGEETNISGGGPVGDQRPDVITTTPGESPEDAGATEGAGTDLQAGEGGGRIQQPNADINAGGPADESIGSEGGPVAETVRNVRPERGVNYVQPEANDPEQRQTFNIIQSYKNNLAALRMMVKLQQEARQATPEEQQVLAKYVGWGGLKTIRFDPYNEVPWTTEARQKQRPYIQELYDLTEQLDPGRKLGYLKAMIDSAENAHYTSFPVIRGIWDALEAAGLRGGNILEPSAGIGNFFAALPESVRKNAALTTVEKDLFTGRLLRYLYPRSDNHIGGFEKTVLPNDYYDLVISNIPFSKHPVKDTKWDNKKDKRYREARKRVHNYFFVRGLDHVRPGGLQVFITSMGTLDAQDAGIVRELLADKAEFLGAVRLPNDAFQGNANTQVVTDVVVLRKYEKDEKPKPFQHEFIDTATRGIQDREGVEQQVPYSSYYQSHPGNMLGTPVAGNFLRYGEPESFDLEPSFPITEIRQQLGDALKQIIPQGLFTKEQEKRNLEIKQRQSNYAQKKDNIRPGNLMLMPDGRAGVFTGVLVDDPELDAQAEDLNIDPEDIRQDRITHYERESLKKAGLDPDLWKIYEVEPLPQNFGKLNYAKLPYILKIRDIENRLLQAELNDLAGLDEMRQELNKVYDSFRKQYGPLNHPENNAVLKREIDQYTIKALEIFDKEKKVWNKSDIFSQRTINAVKEVLSADSLQDAILVSARELGYVNMDRIGQLLGKAPEVIMEEELKADHPLIFKTPGGDVVTKDEYLTGDVKTKLAEAEKALETDGSMAVNIRELKKVIPEDITGIDVWAPPQSRWIPLEYLRSFLKEKVPSGHIHYDQKEDKMYVSIPETDADADIYNIPVKGGGYGYVKRADWIWEKVLNNEDMTVKIKVGEGEDARMVPDDDYTAIAEALKAQIRNEWDEYRVEDPERRRVIDGIYNELHNRVVVREHYDGSHLDLPGLMPYPLGFNLRPHQKDGIWRFVQTGGGIMDHMVGSGKAQSLDSKILTPTGWKLMGDMKIGDDVIAVNGKATKVLGVFPQGEKEMFKVVFSDGSYTECCEEHLWLTQTYGERNYASMNREGKDWNCDQPKVRSLAEIRQTLTGRKIGNHYAKNHSIPLVAPVAFEERPVEADAYLIGLLLGDGSLTVYNRVNYSTTDPEITEAVNVAVLKHNLVSVPRGGCDYGIRNIKRWKGHTLRDILKDLGLMGKRSEDKFVPDLYKFNSVETRLAVLQGLMDTDGTVGKKGTSTSFCSTSKQLADDVIFLVRSLGGTASINATQKYYKNKFGERVAGQIAFVVFIKMPSGIKPFRLSRKLAGYKEKTKYGPVRYIVDVVPIGKKEAQCIRVEDSNHLYVTDDFIVTHNTLTMVATAMEMRRLGLRRKPMITGLKSQVPQLYYEAKKAYPLAKILFPREVDFEPKNRKRLLSQIATNDFDIIILAHSQFEKLIQSPEIAEEVVKEMVAEVDDLIAAETDVRKIDDLVKKRDKLLEKANDLRQRERDEDVLRFDQLGIDQLFVDESQEFKNLEYATRHNNVRGLGNPEGSKRSFNMLLAARHLQKHHGADKGVIFASGTPVSNSMAELYLLYKFLTPSSLIKTAIKSFDQWADVFAEASAGLEYYLGKFKSIVRFRKFVNVPEMIKAYRTIADVRNSENLDIERPKAVSQLVALKRTATQERQFKMLEEYIATKGNMWRHELGLEKGYLEERGINPAYGVMATTYGRKLSLDPRLVDAKFDAGGKIEAVTNNIKTIYDKSNDFQGTQLVFVDDGTPKSPNKVDNLFSYLNDERGLDGEDMIAIFGEAMVDGEDVKPPKWADVKKRMMEILTLTDEQAELLSKEANEANQFEFYPAIKKALVEKGIPENEVAFIHSYNTRDQRLALYAAVNEGKIRVLIGSTAKMGVGVNVQKRAIAAHHMDIKWRPSDLEQRNGRVERQGNDFAKSHWNNQVDIYFYATEQSLDPYMYELVGQKAKFINALKLGKVTDREMPEIDEEFDMSTIASILSGDPLFIRKEKLKKEIRRQDGARKGFASRKTRAQDNADASERSVARSKARVKELTAIDTIVKANQQKHITEASTPEEKEKHNARLEAARNKLKELEAQRDAAKAELDAMPEGADLLEGDLKARADKTKEYNKLNRQIETAEDKLESISEGVIFNPVVDGKTYETVGEFGQGILDFLKAKEKTTPLNQEVLMGNLWGMDLLVTFKPDTKEGERYVAFRIANSENLQLLPSRVLFTRHAISVGKAFKGPFMDIEKNINDEKWHIKQEEPKIAKYKEQAKGSFPEQKQLDHNQKLLKAIEAEILTRSKSGDDFVAKTPEELEAGLLGTPAAPTAATPEPRIRPETLGGNLPHGAGLFAPLAGEKVQMQTAIPEKTTVAGALQHIIDDNDKFSGLAKHILETADKTSLNTPVVVADIPDKRSVYQLRKAGDTVKIDRNDAANAVTILHELTHAATARKIPDRLRTASLQELKDYLKDPNADGNVKEMVRIYLAAKEAVSGEKYGLKNLDEFMAEGYSSPAFQQELSKVKDNRGKSLWQKFVNAVKGLLGIGSQGNLLESLMKAGAMLMAAEQIATQAREADIKSQGTPQEKAANLRRIFEQAGDIVKQAKMGTYEARISEAVDFARREWEKLTQDDAGKQLYGTFPGATLREYFSKPLQQQIEQERNIKAKAQQQQQQQQPGGQWTPPPPPASAPEIEALNNFDLHNDGVVKKSQTYSTMKGVFNDQGLDSISEMEYRSKILNTMLEQGLDMLSIFQDFVASQGYPRANDITVYGPQLYDYIRYGTKYVNDPLSPKMGVLMVTYLGELYRQEAIAKQDNSPQRGEITRLKDQMLAYYTGYMRAKGQEIASIRMLRMFRDYYMADYFADLILKDQELASKRRLETAVAKTRSEGRDEETQTGAFTKMSEEEVKKEQAEDKAKHDKAQKQKPGVVKKVVEKVTKAGKGKADQSEAAARAKAIEDRIKKRSGDVQNFTDDVARRSREEEDGCK